jgi:hypothetical protein
MIYVILFVVHVALYLYFVHIALHPKHSNLGGDSSKREEIVSQSDDGRAVLFDFPVNFTEYILQSSRACQSHVYNHQQERLTRPTDDLGCSDGQDPGHREVKKFGIRTMDHLGVFWCEKRPKLAINDSS